MAALKKSPYEKTNLTLKRRIKHPAVKLAMELEFPSLSALVEKLLEVQLLRHGKIEPEFEPASFPELNSPPPNGKARKA